MFTPKGSEPLFIREGGGGQVTKDLTVPRNQGPMGV